MEDVKVVIDKLVEKTKEKKNPSMVGIDPEWNKIPYCYKKNALSKAEVIFMWAKDIIDCTADIVPAVKPQMGFYEVYGAEGVDVFQRLVAFAHEKDLVVIDDSKRNDIGNTAKAYAYAHLSKEGPINADFLTVSPFLGTDSIQPFLDVAQENGKGVFVLVKTSNPSSVEISQARNESGEKISDWLGGYVNKIGQNFLGESGYSFAGAVVGATFPKEADRLRELMPNNYFLVPGFGAQGGSGKDITSCFNEDGLGAVVSSSRGILYRYLEVENYDNTRKMYLDIVRKQTINMQKEIYGELKKMCTRMEY